MKEEKHFCQNCGQSVMKHKHTLSRSLVLILLKASKSGLTPFHLQNNLNLTKNEYANFQKLKYWDLVSRDDEHSGFWQITVMGNQFLAGNFSPPKSVMTFNNKVINTEGKVNIVDLRIEPIGYKQREEYVEDACPVFESPQFRFA